MDALDRIKKNKANGIRLGKIYYAGYSSRPGLPLEERNLNFTKVFSIKRYRKIAKRWDEFSKK